MASSRNRSSKDQTGSEKHHKPTVQALVWVILPIFALMSYNCTLYQEIVPTGHYKDYLNSYFQGSRCSQNYSLFECVENITQPEHLVIWISFILVVNLLLLISSLVLISVIVAITSKNLSVWIYVYLFFCFFSIILDVGFTSVVSTDTSTALASSCVSEVGSLTLLSIAIIASKGIILWLGDICFFLFILIMTIRTKSPQMKMDTATGSTSSSEFALANSLDDLNRPVRILPVETAEYNVQRKWPTFLEVVNANSPPNTALYVRQQSDPQINYNRGVLQLNERSSSEQQIRIQEGVPFRSVPLTRQETNIRHEAPYRIQHDNNRWRQEMGPPPPTMEPLSLRAGDNRPVHVLPSVARAPSGVARPHSLQEAIRTMRPLRKTNSPYRHDSNIK